MKVMSGVIANYHGNGSRDDFATAAGHAEFLALTKVLDGRKIPYRLEKNKDGKIIAVFVKNSDVVKGLVEPVWDDEFED